MHDDYDPYSNPVDYRHSSHPDSWQSPYRPGGPQDPNAQISNSLPYEPIFPILSYVLQGAGVVTGIVAAVVQGLTNGFEPIAIVVAAIIYAFIGFIVGAAVNVLFDFVYSIATGTVKGAFFIFKALLFPFTMLKRFASWLKRR